MSFFELLKAIFIGIVEGITEWLPISSTGHMILVDEFVRLDVSEHFLEMFLVVIQLGAIAAVPILFFNKLNPFSRSKTQAERNSTWKLWGKVVIGVLPAAVIGVLLDDFLEEHLYNYVVVALALIVYGVIFILLERFKRNSTYRIEAVEDIGVKDALVIGAFQMLSLIPGTSRSGSTILGGMLFGVSRVASAEFSFFMAIPVMIGASLLKIAKFLYNGFTASSSEIILLAVGLVVSFAVSLVSIKFLMDFVKRHTFIPFGIYRIVLGVIVVGFFVIKSII